MHVAFVKTHPMWMRTASTFASVSEVTDFDTVRLRPQRLLYPVNSAIEARRIGKALAQVNARCPESPVDVIHVAFHSAARASTQAAISSGRPLVISEHSPILTGAAPHLQRLDAGVVKRAGHVYRRARAVIAVSDYLADAIYERTGVSATVIPTAVDTTLFELTDPGESFHAVIRLFIPAVGPG